MSNTMPTTYIANNVLSRSFRDGVGVNPTRLNHILYIVESEYTKKTGGFIFSEGFSTWTYGPTLFSVFDQFSCFERGNIDRYATNARGEAFVVNENDHPYLRAALDDVWRKTMGVGFVELVNILREPGSAWDKAFQAEKPYLERKDILADESYRLPLGFDVERF